MEGSAVDRECAPRDGLTLEGLAREGLTREGLTREGLTREGLTREGLLAREVGDNLAGSIGAYSGSLTFLMCLSSGSDLTVLPIWLHEPKKYILTFSAG